MLDVYQSRPGMPLTLPHRKARVDIKADYKSMGMRPIYDRVVPASSFSYLFTRFSTLKTPHLFDDLIVEGIEMA